MGLVDVAGLFGHGEYQREVEHQVLVGARIAKLLRLYDP